MIVKKHDTDKTIFNICCKLLERVNTPNEIDELDRRQIIQEVSYIAGLTGCSYSEDGVKDE